MELNMLMTDNNHIDPIIARYLANEASHEDLLLLMQWMNESEENKRYVEQIQWLHNTATSSSAYQKVDVAKAWNKVRKQTVEATSATRSSFRIGRKTWMSIAASIVILIGIASFWKWMQPTNETINYSFVSKATPVNKTIGNSIQLCLNRHTQISVTENKKTKTKEMQLSGEAFIQVNHQPDETLIVKAGETLIKDIGTAFNVKAIPGSNTIEVFVETGEVEFYTATLAGIHLTQGETGIYDKQTRFFQKHSIPNSNTNAYKTHKFVFKNMPLSEAIEQINAVYPNAISLENPDLGNNTITVTFNNERIDAIASILSETLGLKVARSDKGYLLHQ